ncbi:hypothetical protein [Neisseria sp. Marseille-Q5346]|jgi:hypothetical protein|uniref:hypothetical protein n=1 Tax=Neisseria sp. Marseille-Q5346 TaxID=2972775 RepID=UPI0021E088F0|nr:hypothetical protein [Neisseria sp. Marseille-Q5346]
MIKDTTRYTIEKVENGYSVRKIIYGLGILSSPVVILLPESIFTAKYKTYGQYCRKVDLAIDKKLARLVQERALGKEV